MTEAITFTGDWYIPNSNNKFHGQALFDPASGIRLELRGSFGQTIYDPLSPDVVWGDTDAGPISIFNCVFGGANETRKILTSTYHVAIVAKGKHFENREEMQFTNVRFGLFNLFNWIGKNGLKYHQPIGDDGSNFSYDYKQPSSINFSLHEKCTGGIYFRGKLKSSLRPREVMLYEDCLVQLQHEEPINYTELLDELTIIQQWITLCTFEQSYPTFIEFILQGTKESPDQGQSKKSLNKSIYFYFSNPYFNIKHKLKTKGDHFLEFANIEDNFSNILSSWYATFQIMQPSLTLGLRYFQEKYLVSSQRFLDQVRAIEIFHRESRQLLSRDNSQLKSLINRICDNPKLVKDEKTWIKDKLSHVYQITFRERLLDLVEIYANPAVIKLLGDVNIFVDQVVINRNQYVHFSRNVENGVLKGFDLNNLSNKVMLLLFRGLLCYCSVPDEAYAFGMNKQFMWIVGNKGKTSK